MEWPGSMANLNIHTYIHTYVRTYVHTYTHTYIYIYICKCIVSVCKYISIHITSILYIHIYTHIRVCAGKCMCVCENLGHLPSSCTDFLKFQGSQRGCNLHFVGWPAIARVEWGSQQPNDMAKLFDSCDPDSFPGFSREFPSAIETWHPPRLHQPINPLKNDGVSNSWDDDIPNIWKNNPNVPNHQPATPFLNTWYTWSPLISLAPNFSQFSRCQKPPEPHLIPSWSLTSISASKRPKAWTFPGDADALKAQGRPIVRWGRWQPRLKRCRDVGDAGEWLDCASIYLSVYRSLSIYPSIYPSFYSIYLSICVYVHACDSLWFL